jgi:crotonobetainyl-CoA:carnitine CoA-transferase CaiB-like acyl-CoA transferase
LTNQDTATGPLAGLRILDLSRILAGPTCTQLFGDLGADVIKVERPGAGDDTRHWGPPYVRDADGADTTESAYYLCANRNKRSVTIDFSKPDGAELVCELLEHCDVLIENLRVGALAGYGLGYDDLRERFPGLVYCSISGFGQDGPYANRGGYDYMAQGIGGIMSLTGEPDGEPMKVAVGIADVVCGMYASSAILAALRHRDRTGEGQYIDLGLADTQVSWLINEGTNYLTSREVPRRRGNAHPNIVPYQLFQTADGYFILAAGNDGQYRRFCTFAGLDELADDPRFATNKLRVAHREELVPRIEAATRRHPTVHWVEGLAGVGVPCVNDLEQVFSDPQFLHRGMKISMDHPLAGSGQVDLIGNPVKLSQTPVSYRRAPPTLGQHTDEVLREVLDMDESRLARLKDDEVI